MNQISLPTRPLGNTGLQIPAVGLGTVKLGRNRGMKYPESYELPSDQTAHALLDIAAEFGANLIDTAPAYQIAEQRLGKLLAERGDRDAWHLSTKAGEWFNGERSSFDFTPEALKQSLEDSLTKLNTDRVELLLIHSDGVTETRLQEIGSFDALKDLKSVGKAHHVGVSTKTVEGARHAITHGMDALMLAYSPADTSMTEVMNEAHAAGLGILVKKALASGHLDTITSQEPTADPVETAMRFSLSDPAVSSVITGTINPDHLRHNLTAAVRACASP